MSSAAASYTDYLRVDREGRGRVAASVQEADLLPSITISDDSEFVAKHFENGIPKQYAPTKLNEEDRKIVALKIAGYRPVEIAGMLGISQNDVSTTLSHPDAAKVIEEVTAQIFEETVITVRKQFVAHAHEAFRTTLSLMKLAKNERVRLEAARDIFKGAGVFDEKNKEGDTPIDKSAAQIIAATLRELAEETEEYRPIGNSADLADLKASATDAQVIEELIQE